MHFQEDPIFQVWFECVWREMCKDGSAPGELNVALGKDRQTKAYTGRKRQTKTIQRHAQAGKDRQRQLWKYNR